MEELSQCMSYLSTMEKALNSKKFKWDRPPHKEPPLWERSELQEERTSASYGSRNRSRQNQTPVRRIAAESNRYAGFEEDSDGQSLSSRSEDRNEADGPQLDVSTEKNDSDSDPPYTEGMDKRRLMIRILNAQGEVFAARALLFRKQSPPAWFLGADQYAHCLGKIHAALIEADSTISKWISKNALNAQTLILLTADADIVDVAVRSMTENRESFLRAAHQQEAYLLQQLQPQWQSRDEVKERMGERWTRNPRPKHDFSRLRLDFERQLKDIRKAVELLNSMDTDGAIESSQRLKTKLHGESPLSPSPKKQRYNGQRPRDLSNRVDFNLYPDATQFGWEFTGSSGVTEFFQKDGVKLDWYFTTATMKTSLDHPKQGRTQLFAGQVDPNTYRAILENPRAHTGKRYHRK
jgi:hypothetical protein